MLSIKELPEFEGSTTFDLNPCSSYRQVHARESPCKEKQSVEEFDGFCMLVLLLRMEAMLEKYFEISACGTLLKCEGLHNFFAIQSLEALCSGYLATHVGPHKTD